MCFVMEKLANNYSELFQSFVGMEEIGMIAEEDPRIHFDVFDGVDQLGPHGTTTCE